MKKIKKGLDLPITGHYLPESSVVKTKQVAVVGTDYVGMKPTMHVKEGDVVSKGQLLFECKKVPGVKFTAPVAGTVAAVNRGERRAFQSVVIDANYSGPAAKIPTWKSGNLDDYDRASLVTFLNDAGLWSALRTRPYSKSPMLDSVPNSIFVTAMDTNPLALDPSDYVSEYQVAFNDGIKVLSRLTEGKVFVCKSPAGRFSVPEGDNIEVQEFSGKHPAGNVGTHIHFLDPVSSSKTVWHIGYQDVVAIGKTIGSGEFFSEKWVALCGPQAKSPRVIKTVQGADLLELTNNEALEGETRVISGSALHGKKVSEGAFQFLTRFSTQVTLLKEERERELLGWHSPGFDKFSVSRTMFSKLLFGKKFPLGTSTHGSPRAIVPIGLYESVMPLDILPTQLVKALLSNDTDTAQALGCLELDEEDLSLLTFVDPGKTDFGPALRKNLDTIEKEG